MARRILQKMDASSGFFGLRASFGQIMTMLTTKKGSAFALPMMVERRGFELNWHFRESESR
jgi:hypothetical protein